MAKNRSKRQAKRKRAFFARRGNGLPPGVYRRAKNRDTILSHGAAILRRTQAR